jgi:hypothetical protein
LSSQTSTRLMHRLTGKLETRATTPWWTGSDEKAVSDVDLRSVKGKSWPLDHGCEHGRWSTSAQLVTIMIPLSLLTDALNTRWSLKNANDCFIRYMLLDFNNLRTISQSVEVRILNCHRRSGWTPKWSPG